MSKSRAEEMRERAARISQTAKAEHAPKTPAASDEQPGLHMKPIRSTVDLAPMRHAQLKAWCGETAVQLGKSRVTTQDVVRAMVERLLTDETFARNIRADLKKESS